MDSDKGIVDEYEKLWHLQKDTEQKLEQLKNQLVRLAQEKNTDFIIGTHKTCSIKPYEKIVYPADKAPLIFLLKSKNLYEQFTTLNYLKLSPKLIKNEISDPEILKLVKKEKADRLSLIDRGI